MKVLVIIPAYNEESSLSSLLEEFIQYQDEYDVIVVDDASLDNTANIAHKYNVPVLQLAANLGIGGAVQTGFKYAVRNHYDVVVQVDGDGQHDPSLIKNILLPIKNNEADCVVGSRYTKYAPDSNYKTPIVRRVGMLFSTVLLFLATRQVVTDTTSGFRALNNRAFEYFSREYPVDHPEAEALLMLNRAGFIIKEIPVKMRDRKTGSSLFTAFKAVQYPMRVLVGFLGILLRGTRK